MTSKIDVSRATGAVIDQAAHAPDLDAACLIIQDAIGQTDGGVAAMYFVCAVDWQSLPYRERQRQLTEYVAREAAINASA